MTSSVRLADLSRWIADEVASGAEGETAVLAGHYAIFTGGSTAVDLLDAPETGGGPAEMLAFTKFTWNAACEAIAAARAHRAKLLVLVDDLQFVIPVLDDRRMQERLADALVTQYLAATPTLPRFHMHRLTAHGLDERDMLKNNNGRWIFSERELRIAHVRHLRDVLSKDPARAGVRATPDMSHITVTSEEHGEYCLVHSGRTTCAGGYVELLSDVFSRGIRRLITLVPMRCLGPITVGTALSSDLLGLDELNVVNVAVPDVASGLAAAVTRSPARRGAAP
ncbi:MAG TPA: hypothetical protein VJR92_01455 [Gemmatimonadaceae bacterium]|nr:hypothetical protein [Gemmatimonadaceae bacterium]